MKTAHNSRYGKVTVTVRGDNVRKGKRISWNGGWRLVGPDGRVFKVKPQFTLRADHGSRYIILWRGKQKT
jgi:hypothetical protein